MQLCHNNDELATLLVSLQKRVANLETTTELMQKQLGAPQSWISAKQAASIKKVSVSTIHRRLWHNKNIVPNIDFKEEGKRIWINTSAIHKL